jgi:hypothetical protein
MDRNTVNGCVAVCYIFPGEDNIFVPALPCRIKLDNVLPTMSAVAADGS